MCTRHWSVVSTRHSYRAPEVLTGLSWLPPQTLQGSVDHRDSETQIHIAPTCLTIVHGFDVMGRSYIFTFLYNLKRV